MDINLFRLEKLVKVAFLLGHFISPIKLTMVIFTYASSIQLMQEQGKHIL